MSYKFRSFMSLQVHAFHSSLSKVMPKLASSLTWVLSGCSSDPLMSKILSKLINNKFCLLIKFYKTRSKGFLGQPD